MSASVVKLPTQSYRMIEVRFEKCNFQKVNFSIVISQRNCHDVDYMARS